MINARLLDSVADAVRSFEPLRLGGVLIEVDTTSIYDIDHLVAIIQNTWDGVGR